MAPVGCHSIPTTYNFTERVLHSLARDQGWVASRLSLISRSSWPGELGEGAAVVLPVDSQSCSILLLLSYLAQRSRIHERCATERNPSKIT